MVDSEQGRDVPTKEREKLAGQNKALPDGSFPIANKSDLRNAIQAFGRASESKKPQVKAHIKRRARALGATDMIPDDWSRRLAMTEETTTETDTEAQNVSLSNVAEKDKKDDDEDDENPFKKKKKSKKKGKKGDKKDDDEKEEKSLHECPHEDCPREEFATERAAEQHLLTVHPQG